MTSLFGEPQTKRTSKKAKAQAKAQAPEYSVDMLGELEIACSRHFRWLRDNTPHNPADPLDDVPFIELDHMWKAVEDTQDLIKRYKRDVNLLAHIWSTSLDFIKSLLDHTATIDDMVKYKVDFMAFYDNYISRVCDNAQAVA